MTHEHNSACPTCGQSIFHKRSRSTEQNKLMWKWVGEIAEQKDDMTAREIQQQMKLLFGVPIMCADDERFRGAWSRLAKKLDYADQLELMDYYAVTSEMTTAQMGQFLTDVFRFFTQQGFRLTHPDDRGLHDADQRTEETRRRDVRRNA